MATIDFGANAFTGGARWLHTAVQCPPDGGFTPLSLQPITPAPMALALPGFYTQTQQNSRSPNIIGGYSGNIISPKLTGATISGGGDIGFENIALGNYATVSGGELNTSSSYATIGGGQANTASGLAATVPGGVGNHAEGNYSFAAGQRAVAVNNGCFVWAESSSTDFFVCTTNDTFLVRASGGVRMYTNSALTSGVDAPPGSGAWNILSDKNVKANFANVDSRLTWNTIDSGGAMNASGGTDTLSGTIGQPDAGVLSGGTYTLIGGFWGLDAQHLIYLPLILKN